MLWNPTHLFQNSLKQKDEKRRKDEASFIQSYKLMLCWHVLSWTGQLPWIDCSGSLPVCLMKMEEPPHVTSPKKQQTRQAIFLHTISFSFERQAAKMSISLYKVSGVI